MDLQRDALTKTGCHQIYEETASGKNSNRPELINCLRALRTGDTFVVWRLDRLGRSLPDLVKIITDLESRGVFFESVTEKIETGSATGKLVFHLFAALAEFERNLIRERTRAGLAAARSRGRLGGRKPKLDAKQVREIKALLRDPEIQNKAYTYLAPSPQRLKTAVLTVNRDSFAVACALPFWTVTSQRRNCCVPPIYPPALSNF